MLWVQGAVFVLWIGMKVLADRLGIHSWLDAPLRTYDRWLYARRERAWLARQPKPDGDPYRSPQGAPGATVDATKA